LHTLLHAANSSKQFEPLFTSGQHVAAIVIVAVMLPVLCAFESVTLLFLLRGISVDFDERSASCRRQRSVGRRQRRT
jgi:hypothetical protein